MSKALPCHDVIIDACRKKKHIKNNSLYTDCWSLRRNIFCFDINCCWADSYLYIFQDIFSWYLNISVPQILWIPVSTSIGALLISDTYNMQQNWHRIKITMPLRVSAMKCHSLEHNSFVNQFHRLKKKRRRDLIQSIEIFFESVRFNSLCSSDGIWRHWTWPTLVQVIACFRAAPIQYPSIHCLITSKVVSRSPWGHSTSNAQDIDPCHELENY